MRRQIDRLTEIQSSKQTGSRQRYMRIYSKADRKTNSQSPNRKSADRRIADRQTDIYMTNRQITYKQADIRHVDRHIDRQAYSSLSGR